MNSRIEGLIKEGYRVASGLTAFSPYPRGTIAMQALVFKSLDPEVDLTHFFHGTLNVAVARRWRMVKPWKALPQVKWADTHPPEDFYFMRCRVLCSNMSITGYIYYPSPETKTVHFQDSSTLEIVAPKIEGIKYGDRVKIEIDRREMEIETNSCST